MKEKIIRCVAVEPNKLPYIKEVRNNLSSLQKEVGGMIDFVPFDDSAYVILNDEGKILGLEPNRILISETGEIVDYYAGNILITAPADNAGNNTSLTMEQAKHYIEVFSNKCIIYPEQNYDWLDFFR